MTDVRDLLRRPIDSDEYEAILELWKSHSKAEDARDIDGLLATLTGDCVYEIVGTPHVWRGHEGATRFYGGLLVRPGHRLPADEHRRRAAGRVRGGRLTGFHEQDWVDYKATAERVEFSVVISSPGSPRSACSRASACT